LFCLRFGKEKGAGKMSHSTDSMLYMILVLSVIYIAGMSLYTGIQKFKKWRDERKAGHWKPQGRKNK